MLKSLLYPAFGTIIIGGYALSGISATDVSTTQVQRSTLPAPYRGTPAAYGTAPIIWRTGFHGPGAYQPSYGGSGGGTYGGGGYGGGWGGK
jgi:hypothetical protein